MARTGAPPAGHVGEAIRPQGDEPPMQTAANVPPAPIEPALFRKVMASFATGVTIITTLSKGEVRGMTANAFMSGSLEPPLCLVSVAKKARMHGILEETGSYGVSILAKGQERFSAHFAGKPNPDLEVRFRQIGTTPILAECAAAMTADVVARHDCGDHTLFVGHIRFMDWADRAPLVYHAGRFGILQPAVEPPPVLDFW